MASKLSAITTKLGGPERLPMVIIEGWQDAQSQEYFYPIDSKIFTAAESAKKITQITFGPELKFSLIVEDHYRDQASWGASLTDQEHRLYRRLAADIIANHNKDVPAPLRSDREAALELLGFPVQSSHVSPTLQ